jgi:purine-binding chemotaxis protein CheW
MNDVVYSEDLESILEERALKLASATFGNKHRDVAFQVALFSVGEESFGVPATSVREIALLPPVTMLPNLPALLLGIIQQRGELISVIDGAELLCVDDAPEPRYCIVLDSPSGPLGIAVTSTDGFEDVHGDELLDGLGKSHRPVSATTRSLVSVVDVERVLAHPSLIVNTC